MRFAALAGGLAVLADAFLLPSVFYSLERNLGQFLISVLALTLLARHWADFPPLSRVVLGRAAYQAFMAWSVLTVSFLLVVGYVAFLRYRRFC